MAKKLIINTLLQNEEEYFECLSEHYQMMLDGVEHESVRHRPIPFKFNEGDKEKFELPLNNFITNLMMWEPFVYLESAISKEYIFDTHNITSHAIGDYLDKFVIIPHRKEFSNKELNLMCASVIENLKRICEDFSMILGVNMNLKSDIDMMNNDPEYRQLLMTKFSTSMNPEEVHRLQDENTKTIVKKIKENPDHCLHHILNAGHGVNFKQFAEYITCIATKPDGLGNIFPMAIDDSYMTTGMRSVHTLYIDMCAARNAQIIAKTQTGDTGYFARKIYIMTQGNRLHTNPRFDCGSTNYELIRVLDRTHLYMLDKKYYFDKFGKMQCINGFKDEFLIGTEIKLRTPITCASNSRGEGICYKCYGDLAHTNNDIIVGGIASRELTSRFTQTNLSAKHLNASNIKPVVWSEGLEKFFDIEFNYVLPKPETISNGNLYIVINVEDIGYVSDEDDVDYNEYVVSCKIVNNKTKEEWEISSDIDTPMYLSEYIKETFMMNKKRNENGFKIPLKEFEVEMAAFLINIENNALSKTFIDIKRTIDRKSDVQSLNRHELLQQFTELLIEGNIIVASVHLETIISNMLRDPNDILKAPDFSQYEPNYTLLSVTGANTNHPSLTSSLSFQYVKAQLARPITFRKKATSQNDQLFMVNWQG